MAYMKLKGARVEKGKTQLDIAELLGINEATYNRKENQSCCFTLPEAQKLSDYFGISIEELFFAE